LRRLLLTAVGFLFDCSWLWILFIVVLQQSFSSLVQLQPGGL
jgi:hypothetical protein